MPSLDQGQRSKQMRDKQQAASYYSAELGKSSAKQFIAGGSGSVDDLDNVLYYLLNHFTASEIRQRLKLAAEVHPNEVARAVFGGKANTSEKEYTGSKDADAEEPQEDFLVPKEEPRQRLRPNSKIEEARRLLGG